MMHHLTHLLHTIKAMKRGLMVLEGFTPVLSLLKKESGEEYN